MSDYLNQLGKCPLFATLVPEELSRIADACRAVRVRAGEMIFHEGQPCDGFYVVAEGSVRLYKIGPDGRERILHIIRPPHAFAEVAMFGAGAYPAFAAAVEDSRLFLVRRGPFLAMLREYPEVSLRLLESISGWMHRLLDQLENETFLNARAKLANFLLRQVRIQAADRAPGRIELPQAKKDLASQLGMAAETFSRALADLKARRLIRASGRQIDILDATALENMLLGGADKA